MQNFIAKEGEFYIPGLGAKDGVHLIGQRAEGF